MSNSTPREQLSPQQLAESFLPLSFMYEIVLGLPADIPPLKALIIQKGEVSTNIKVGHLHILIRNTKDSDLLDCISRVDHVMCSVPMIGHFRLWEINQRCQTEGKKIYFSSTVDAYTLIEEMLNSLR